MSTENQGTQSNAGQGAAENTQTTQQSTEQAQQTAATQQQATTATSTAQSPSPEQIAQWQQEAQRASQLDQNYRALQAEYTRTRQAMAALTGNQNGQQQQDPAAEHIQNYLKAGYSKEDAELLGRGTYASLAPLIQQNQQLQAAIQGNAIVGDVLREGWSKAPQLFSDPSVLQSVEQVLRAEAMRGNQINAEYAIDLAFVADGRKKLASQAQTPPQHQMAPQTFGQFGFAGHSGSPQTTQQQTQQPLSGEAKHASDAVRARYGLPAKS